MTAPFRIMVRTQGNKVIGYRADYQPQVEMTGDFRLMRQALERHGYSVTNTGPATDRMSYCYTLKLHN